MKKLQFKDGYAIIVKSVSEETSEYHVDRSVYNVEVVFKTAVAIKRFAEYVGTWIMDRDEKKYLLERKKSNKTVSFNARIPLEMLPTETHPFWYEKYGVGYSYENHYTGEHFYTKIPTTRDGLKEAKKRDAEFLRLYKEAMVGSCAGGYSFKSLADSYATERNVISTRY